MQNGFYREAVAVLLAVLLNGRCLFAFSAGLNACRLDVHLMLPHKVGAEERL